MIGKVTDYTNEHGVIIREVEPIVSDDAEYARFTHLLTVRVKLPTGETVQMQRTISIDADCIEQAFARLPDAAQQASIQARDEVQRELNRQQLQLPHHLRQKRDRF